MTTASQEAPQTTMWKQMHPRPRIASLNSITNVWTSGCLEHESSSQPYCLLLSKLSLPNPSLSLQSTAWRSQFARAQRSLRRRDVSGASV